MEKNQRTDDPAALLPPYRSPQPPTPLVPVGAPVGDADSKPDVTLDRLLEVAGPYVQKYFESQERIHQRNLEFEEKVLEHDSRRQRHVVWSVGVIVAVVLLFAGYLISKGRDAVALDVIKLVASLGSVGFGGYGIAMSRRRREEDEN
jgi:hypothetical protein